MLTNSQWERCEENMSCPHPNISEDIYAGTVEFSVGNSFPVLSNFNMLLQTTFSRKDSFWLWKDLIINITNLSEFSNNYMREVVCISYEQLYEVMGLQYMLSWTIPLWCRVIWISFVFLVYPKGSTFYAF